MARYIDADKLTKVIEGIYLDGDSPYSYHATGEGDTLIGKFQVIDIIIDQPTADVEEVRHGEWVKPYALLRPYCSACKAVCKDDVYTKFCHECGAKMDGGKE